MTMMTTCEIQEVKAYEKEVRDFVKRHPVPSSDNEGRERNLEESN